MASIIDVAAAAGVSVATVSRVLTNKPHVRPQLRERVLAAVEQLDYQPSRLARSLRMQRSQVYGLIIPDIQNPFFTALARAVEDVAHQNQHAVFLCNTDEDADKERMYVALMEAEQVAGVIIAPTQEEDSACRWLIEAGIPVVAVDRRLPDLEVDTVLVDNADSAAAIVAHLAAEGYERVGAIVGPASTTTGRERLAGYRRGLEEAGLPYRAQDVRSGHYTEEAGLHLALDLLEQPDPPPALLAANNLLGAGVLAAVRARGLALPEDLALAVIGETPCMQLVQPNLTVARHPIYEMGVTAVRLLMDRTANRSAPPREVVLHSQIVVGQSSLLRSRNKSH